MKFSNFTKKLISAIFSSGDLSQHYVVGHTEKNNSQDNVKIPLSDITTKIGSATLTSQTTFQSNDLIGVTSYLIFLNGDEADGAGLLNNVNNETGTITFTTAQTGKLKYILKY